jgi:hypothetical protein
MSNYCKNCGGKTFPDSLFCETCGSQLTPSRNVSFPRSEPQNRGEFTSRTRTPRYSSTTSPRYHNTSGYPYRKKSSSHLGLIIGIIIIGVIGISALSALFIGIFPLLDIIDSHDYVGSHDYTIGNNENFTHLNVIIDNSIGSVNVIFEDHLSTLLNAQIQVYAKNDYDLYGSDVADVGQDDENRLYFQFTPYSDSSWNSHYKYDVDLYISSNLATNLQIDVSTGSIMVDVRNTLIEELFLETSTGSIDATFVNVQFNNTDYSYYHIDTSTGSVNTYFQNVTYTDEANNPYWGISTSTGSVNVGLYQKQSLNSSLIVDYDVSTSTGSVTCIFVFNDSIGYSLDASTSLGDINIGGYETEITLPYSSENYQIASLKYDIQLSTSTGSIEIYREPI